MNGEPIPKASSAADVRRVGNDCQRQILSWNGLRLEAAQGRYSFNAFQTWEPGVGKLSIWEARMLHFCQPSPWHAQTKALPFQRRFPCPFAPSLNQGLVDYSCMLVEAEVGRLAQAIAMREKCRQSSKKERVYLGSLPKRDAFARQMTLTTSRNQIAIASVLQKQMHALEP